MTKFSLLQRFRRWLRTRHLCKKVKNAYIKIIRPGQARIIIFDELDFGEWRSYAYRQEDKNSAGSQS